MFVSRYTLDKFMASPSNEIENLRNLNWDFKGANTQELTHGIHVYPARMVPFIPRILIKKFSRPGEKVLDPFCGSGTVLLEAMIQQRQSVGIDINPLAVLISQVKTTPLDLNTLIQTFNDLRKKILSDKQKILNGTLKVEPPIFKNIQKQINHWFKPEVQLWLTVIRRHVNNIPDEDIKKFFQVVFSNTVRKVSNTRDNEYKLYRMAPEQLEKYNPDVVQIFLDYCEQSIQGMRDLNNFLTKGEKKLEIYRPEVLQGDFRSINLPEGEFDLMITSPPYGDSHTTVGYGQFSKFSLYWLGEEFASYIPKSRDMLGGKNKPNAKVHSETLEQTLEQIRKNESDLKRKRSIDVLSFFADYEECVKKIHENLKDNAYACFVVGNRTVREVRIRMDKITQEIGEHYGFKHVITIPRNIPTKRHPKSQKLYVDPKWEEVQGKRKAVQIDNIVKEHIVILQK